MLIELYYQVYKPPTFENECIQCYSDGIVLLSLRVRRLLHDLMVGACIMFYRFKSCLQLYLLINSDANLS